MRSASDASFSPRLASASPACCAADAAPARPDPTVDARCSACGAAGGVAPLSLRALPPPLNSAKRALLSEAGSFCSAVAPGGDFAAPGAGEAVGAAAPSPPPPPCSWSSPSAS